MWATSGGDVTLKETFPLAEGYPEGRADLWANSLSRLSHEHIDPELMVYSVTCYIDSRGPTVI